MKKEISDHIARAFFEKRAPKKPNEKYFFIVVTCCAVALFILLGILMIHGKVKNIYSLGQNIVLDKHDGPYVLNFDFSNTTAKIESINISVPDINIGIYRYLQFSVRLKDTLASQKGTLRVGLTNQRNETASLYVPGITPSWRRIKIPLSEFSKIGDRSGTFKLSFMLEEWNQFSKKGKLFIDSVEFSKN